VNILNNQLQTIDMVWSSRSGLHKGLTTLHYNKTKMLHWALDLGRFFGMT